MKLALSRPSGCRISWLWSPGSPRDPGPIPHQAEACPPCWLSQPCLFSKLSPNPLNLFTSHLPACLVASISAFPAQPAICDLHVGNFFQSGSTWPLAVLAASSWAARMLVSSCGQLLGELVFFVFFLLSPQNHLCCVWSSFYIFPRKLLNWSPCMAPRAAGGNFAKCLLPHARFKPH